MAVPLNENQWPNFGIQGLQMGVRPPRFPQAQNGADFRYQMEHYRRMNDYLPAVQEYGQRQQNGYWAHTEGLYQQARSVDSPASLPLGERDPAMHGFTMGQLKADNIQKNYRPEYRDNLREAVINGTSDPVHVGPGHELLPNYPGRPGGPSAGEVARNNLPERQVSHDIFLGNGNHRVTMAHTLGVQFIPAKGGDRFGTGDEAAFGGSGRYGNKHRSWVNENPEAI